MPTTIRRTVGRYRLERLIGKGGMAEVYRATDTRLERTVAIKVMQPSLVSQRTSLQHFLCEAREVAALEHPNILPIYDFGEQDGAPYLVTPLMTDGTLAERIGASGLPPAQVVDYVAGLARSLDAAHDAGIVHRDVKPENVLMDRNARPLLADFGLARDNGTPPYVAPELVQGAEASASSDLYALGVLAYQMLSGTTPFCAESSDAVLQQHLTRKAPPLSTRVHGLPPSVDDVVDRALSKQPGDRFPSGIAMARALGEALDCSLPGATAPAVVVPLAGSTPAPAGSGARWSVLFVVLFALLGIMLGARSLQRRTVHPRKGPITDLAGTGLQAEPDDPTLRALAAFADGSLAYAQGDDARARAAIDRVRSTLGDEGSAHGIETWIAEGIPVDSLADWELAAIYRDARGVGLPLVEKRLARAPEDHRARVGRALLLSLAGRQEEAISQLLVVPREELRGIAFAGELLRAACDGGDDLACRRLSR